MIYDPILFDYYSKEQWLFLDENNIIINNYASNKEYYNNVPDSNLLIEVFEEFNHINYRKTLRNHKYIDLNKYGIPLITEYSSFINSTNREIKLINKKEINAFNYEYILNNPNTYNTKHIYGFNENEFESLQNYTYQYDVAINGILRNKEYFNSEEFNKIYSNFGITKDESIDKIRNSIKYIDESFLKTQRTEDDFVIFRGISDLTLYTGLNLGYISTSKNFDIAKDFSKKSGAIYEMHISPGIPYIYLESDIKSKKIDSIEDEILLPRNLIVTLVKQIENIYVVNVDLSSIDQFNIQEDHKKYNVSIIEDYINTPIIFEKCYKNNIINGKIIDEITKEEIDPLNSIDIDGLCYNKSTLIDLFNINKQFSNPFSKIKFNNKIIFQLLDDIIKQYNINDIVLYFINNEEIILYLFENYNVDINYQNGIFLNKAVKFDNLIDFLIDNKITLQNNDLLNIASKVGNLKIVKLIIEEKTQSEKDLALIEASKNGHLEIVKFLIDNGANIHTEDDGVLFEAVENDHLDVVKFLIDNGIDILDNTRILNTTLNNKNLDIFNYLLEKGAIIENEFLCSAIISEKIDMVKLSIDKFNIKPKDKDILLIVYNNDTKLLKYLLEKGLNINYENNSLFLKAAFLGKFNIVKFLIDNDVSIKTNKYKVILNASKSENLNLLEYLINNIEVDSSTDEEYLQQILNESLTNALKTKNKKFINYLLKNTIANINSKENIDELIKVSRFDNLEEVKYLIENDVNYNHKYNEHLLMAAIFNNIEIVKYLLDFGDRITIKEYHNTLIQKFPKRRISSSIEELILKYE